MSIEEIQSDVKQLVPPKKVVLYCSQHQGKELDLYCETCEELCTVKIHKYHQYDLVGDTFERHKEEMTTCVEPVENDLSITRKAKEQLGVRCQELDDQGAAVKADIQQEIRQLQEVLEPDMLPPCEPVNVKFVPSSVLEATCKHFGEVYIQEMSLEKCYTTSKGLGVAKLAERATAVLHVVNDKGKAYDVPVEAVTSELESESTRKKTKCSVKKTEASQYEISYQPTSRGRHQLHIKVEGRHIKRSPFLVIVKLPVQKLGTPTKIIGGLKGPWGVAVNKKGDIIVVEYGGSCVSIFSPEGGRIKSFGSCGSNHGQFKCPSGVAVDTDDNILVADCDNHRIQKFTSDGNFIASVGKHLVYPCGIGIHPRTRKVYVADSHNHRVQILNPDLTFSSSFGSYGSDNGQFKYPYDVTFDSTGNEYVADSWNHCIQVFTAKGKFIRKFGKKGRGNGELDYFSSISIDTDNVVYVTEQNNHRVSVFTSEGKFLTSFGTKGSGPGQFYYPRGTSVDKNGVVYVADYSNNRIQIF